MGIGGDTDMSFGGSVCVAVVAMVLLPSWQHTKKPLGVGEKMGGEKIWVFVTGETGDGHAISRVVVRQAEGSSESVPKLRKWYTQACRPCKRQRHREQQVA